jgi:hypothetical protein
MLENIVLRRIRHGTAVFIVLCYVSIDRINIGCNVLILKVCALTGKTGILQTVKQMQKKLWKLLSNGWTFHR